MGVSVRWVPHPMLGTSRKWGWTTQWKRCEQNEDEHDTDLETNQIRKIISYRRYINPGSPRYGSNQQAMIFHDNWMDKSGWTSYYVKYWNMTWSHATHVSGKDVFNKGGTKLPQAPDYKMLKGVKSISVYPLTTCAAEPLHLIYQFASSKKSVVSLFFQPQFSWSHVGCDLHKSTSFQNWGQIIRWHFRELARRLLQMLTGGSAGGTVHMSCSKAFAEDTIHKFRAFWQVKPRKLSSLEPVSKFFRDHFTLCDSMAQSHQSELMFDIFYICPPTRDRLKAPT